jgi:hypothetical protein
MKIETLPTEKLIPYARNTRTHSDEQVAQIAASIREFGFTNPVLIDGQDGIIAGHGRVMAARKLGLNEVPCIRLGHLTDAQRRAYIIADNKLALNAGWDEELLAVELADLREMDFDLNLTGFDGDAIEVILNPPEPDALSDAYTHKVDAPVYEPNGEKPPVAELIDNTRAEELRAAITKANLPAEVSAFLNAAADRHTVFNFEKIAEFYCHADKQTQELMEDSALVIIDFKKAMQLGYVKLKEEIAQALTGQSDDEK